MSTALAPMAGARRFGEILVDMGVVSPESVESALELQLEKGGRIGEILLDMEAISADDVAKALAELQREEDAYNSRCAELKATGENESLGVVARNRAKHELALVHCQGPNVKSDGLDRGVDGNLVDSISIVRR